MSNLSKDYELGVGKTVLELFKKVLKVRNDYESSKDKKSTTSTNLINQTGGANGDSIETKTGDSDIGMVNLIKGEQYYDGTIYEGSINLSGTEMILFNIKDRTGGHLKYTDLQPVLETASGTTSGTTSGPVTLTRPTTATL